MIIILFEYDITIVIYIIIFTPGNIKFRLIILLYIVRKKNMEIIVLDFCNKQSCKLL